MTRPIAAPPPEIIATLSDLLAVVLNGEASAKIVDDLRAASNEYQTAKYEYEVSIGQSVRAKQDAEAAAANSQALLDQLSVEKANQAQDLAGIVKGRAELENGMADLNAQLEKLTADRAAFDLMRDAYEAGIQDRIAKADKNLADSEAMRAKIETKLAMLKE